ncbi:uncharacterized protein LOC143859119 [Tasmannia lanceolata]|uniref:uncharacterized protein LOC143859119 n=1 Tax=Tasmannia lanceolata TaxID=3420 RepID=UPI004063A534
MTSLFANSSPNSFQLRLGFKCKQSTFFFLRMNFRTVNCRRIRAFSASGSAFSDSRSAFSASGSVGRDDGTREEERTRAGQSWMNSDAPENSFSGWFDKDSGNGSGPKQEFGGILGAGLAGVFLAASLAFASLSFSKRSTPGPKQQMEPLTTQQELLLVSDDRDENISQVGKDGNTVFLDEGNQQSDCDLECNTGINQDSFSPIEAAEATSENSHEKIDVGPSLSKNAEFDTNGIDVIDNTVPTTSNLRSTEFSESDIVDCSSDACCLEGSDSATVSDTPETVIELNENLGTADLVNLPLSDTESANLTNDNQEGIFVSLKMDNPELNSDSDGIFVSLKMENPELNSDSAGLLPSKSVTLGSLVNSESDANLDSQVQNVTETLTPVSNPHDFNPSKTLESPPEHHSLNEIGSFGAPIPESSFSYAGIPAPSLVSAALRVSPGKVVVPALVDQIQGQALAALQVLKVIEADVQPGDLCTRREYARWLVSASSVLSRNTISKVYPAMFIENVTELAFDDVTPEDPDFPPIQGLAEAGLISSKLSRNDAHKHSLDEEHDPILFLPESPLSRQDLVSWKMALEKRQLPDVDKKILYQSSGFIDIDKINPDAWPALVADLSAGEHGITALAFGHIRMFQPDKPVTKAQAAIALATGDAAEVVGEELTRIEAESMAETVVAAHTALVAQVEEDLNASFEKELSIEREKVGAFEKLAEETRLELERLKAEREEENNVLMRGRAAVESEMEVLSRLRLEVVEQLQSLMSNKMEISFERDRINKLRKETESENQVIVQLHYDLEVERKALSMARAWAEDETKRAREQAKALEEARENWERRDIKVVVDEDLKDNASAAVTWVEAEQQSSIGGTVNRAEKLVDRLKAMAGELKGKSSVIIERIIQKIEHLISVMKQRVIKAARQAGDLRSTIVLKASRSAEEFQQNAVNFGSSVKDGTKRIVEDCREGVEKITQKFKT